MATSQAEGGTRSGLLWEVERILTELSYDKRPTCLMLENVPQVCGNGNLEHWKKWVKRLEELGYQTFSQIINAKDYGIPQNRKRLFAISIKTSEEISYQIPAKINLRFLLKNLMQNQVDEKFFIPTKLLENIIVFDKSIDVLDEDKCKQIADMNYYNHEQSNRIYGIDGLAPTIRTGNDYAKAIKIGYEELEPEVVGGIGEKKSNGGTQFYEQNRIYNNKIATCINATINPYYIDKHSAIDTSVAREREQKHLKIRKLTPCECMLLMGFTKEDYENMVKAGLSDNAIFHIAGDSIVTTCIAAQMYSFFHEDENGHIDLINRYVDERVKEINEDEQRRF